MTKMISWLLLLLCLVGDIIDIRGQRAYETFGTRDLWTLQFGDDDLQLTDKIKDPSKLIALLDNEVQNEGDVFAFTARMYDTQPFYFQIWRPVGNDMYQLIDYRRVIPSVKQQYEDFFLLGDHCMRVQSGDRLGLYFNTTVPSVYYGFKTSFHYKADLPFTVGTTLKFSQSLVVVFLATGYVHINSNTTEDPTRVNCPKDVRIDYTNATHVTSTTTTYVPPTGIPGMKGATGEQGPRGLAGGTGATGQYGVVGDTGSTGLIGLQGPLGQMGENNTVTGDVGATGENGSRGMDGSIGRQGLQGDMGEQGPQGRSGKNYTVVLYGPYRSSTVDDDGMSGDRWWASTMAMSVVYIWLAAATLVLLLTFIIILVVCCQCCAVRRALKKHVE